MILPKVIKWVKLETLEKSPIKECNFDIWHKDALIQELVKNEYIICGDTHQNLAIPVFTDGYLVVSMRTWADIMNDAYAEIDPYGWVKNNIDEHTFYMASSCIMNEKVPKCE